MSSNSLRDQFKSFFNLTPYLEDENLAKQSIIEGVSFRGPNILILIFAIFVASLGLNTNSPAVIIGAMLISPLMGPIIGIGLGVGTYDFPLIKRAARNLAAATLFSVLTATIYFLISPVSEGHSELLARTSPTIYDVLIAVFGGAAGIVAIACKQKGNVIPGVAIATALMPPLCTAGYGIATWQLQYFAGAFYLFLINSIFIALATLVGVKLFKFTQVKFVDPQRRKRIKSIVTTVVICTMLPSVYLTAQMLVESYFVSEANALIESEVNLPNTLVQDKDVTFRRWKKSVKLTLIGAYVNTDSLREALTAEMDKSRLLRGTDVTIVQRFSVGGEQAAAAGDNNLAPMVYNLMAERDNYKSAVDSLQSVILRRDALDSIAWQIAPELNTIFPQIKYISLTRNYVCDIDTRTVDTVNVALIQLERPIPDMGKLRDYLQVRTNMNDIHIIKADAPSSK
ncbi:MAG: DUF389 domain-containing protein [Muribaculaceae bacterium]|nr:DUF389 domain-containing protein [Muribaculaceae bacterium]